MKRLEIQLLSVMVVFTLCVLLVMLYFTVPVPLNRFTKGVTARNLKDLHST